MASDISKLRTQWASCSLAELKNIYEILDKEQYPDTERALLEVIQKRRMDLEVDRPDAVRLELSPKDLEDQKPATPLMLWSIRLLGILILAFVFFMTIEVTPSNSQSSFTLVSTWGSFGIMLILASIIGEWKSESDDQFIERIYLVNPGKTFIQSMIRVLIVVATLVCSLFTAFGLIFHFFGT